MIDVSFLSCRKWTGRPPCFRHGIKGCVFFRDSSFHRKDRANWLDFAPVRASLRTVMTDSSIPDMMAEARRGQWTDQQLAAKAVELAESILKQSNAGMRGKREEAGAANGAHDE